MIALKLAEIAAATDGRLHNAAAETAVDGPVVIDSRDVMPGALFVARVGEHRDGHDFARAAADAGAVAVLAERPLDVPSVVVGNSEQALGLLARDLVDRLTSRTELTVVGVTGSSGKTTTKDLLAQVLAPLGPLVAPAGSLNTEVGVPLTVLRADESTRTLIVEMGARGVGHIEYLCGIAPPRIGVVLNVGTAHVGEFGDRDATARAKGELVEGLPGDGVAVLNADDPLVRGMAERAGPDARIIMFGESVHADVRAVQVELDDRGLAGFVLETPDGSAPVGLTLVGAHNVPNALAVAAVAGAMGMPVDEVAAGLSAATPQSRWRMEVTERPDGVTVVNDAYNANPESMRAALETLAHLTREQSGARRSWAVLGEMRELGERASVEHEQVGHRLARLGISGVIAVGDGARGIVRGAGAESSWSGEAVWAPDAETASDMMRQRLRPGDVVLVKASRATGLESVAEELAVEKDVTR